MKNIKIATAAVAAVALSLSAVAPAVAKNTAQDLEAVADYGDVGVGASIPSTFLIVGGILVVVVAAVALGGGGSQDPSGSPA